MKFVVTEVHNFGGFFGGDTVTLNGAPWRAEEAAEERTLTIDQAALANVADRHSLVAGMLLELTFAGERVDRAVLLGAPSHAELRRALGDPHLGPFVLEPVHAPALGGPHVLSHRCPACELWVATAHDPDRCPVCATPVEALDRR
jgi:rubrerythrin